MKHWQKFAVVLIFFPLLFQACQEKEEKKTGSLEIVFRGTFGDEPLYMFDRAYTYRQDAQIKWQMFQFYLSDLELQPVAGIRPEQMLSPVELISFSDMHNEADALEGFSLIFNELETGSYDHLQFGLGVSPELNATQPSDYQPSDPLAQVSNYWEAASSYIYAKIEGNADLDNDGQFGEEEEKITFHVGASDLFEKRTIPVSLEIRENNRTTLEVQVDLLKALEDPAQNTFIDFRQTPKDHHKNPDVYNLILNQLRERAINVGN